MINARVRARARKNNTCYSFVPGKLVAASSIEERNCPFPFLVYVCGPGEFSTLRIRVSRGSLGRVINRRRDDDGRRTISGLTCSAKARFSRCPARVLGEKPSRGRSGGITHAMYNAGREPLPPPPSPRPRGRGRGGGGEERAGLLSSGEVGGTKLRTHAPRRPSPARSVSPTLEMIVVKAK